MASKHPQTFEEFLRVWGKTLRSKAYYRSLTLKSKYWGREDLHQEMLMGAWVGWNKWPPKSTIPRDIYALVCARRFASNRLRRQMRAKRGSEGELSYIEDIDGANLYREPELAVWLGKYIARLPEVEQEYLYAYFMEDKSVGEITPVYSTSSNRLRRAIQTLRAKLTSPTLKVRRIDGKEFNQPFQPSEKGVPPRVTDPLRDASKRVSRSKYAKRIAL